MESGSTLSETVPEAETETQQLTNEMSNNGSGSGSMTPPAAKKRKFVKALPEQDVGIVLTIGKITKIIGIIKERYSDFHVNEVDPDGNIVRLTSFDLPVENTPVVTLSDPALSKWIDNETLKQLQDLQDANDNESKLKCVEFLATSMDKEVRTMVHRWLANFDKLVSTTTDKNGEKYISVKHRSKEVSRFTRRPASRARYTHCVLYKEGIETSDAIGFLSSKLRLNPNLITYAGTKDKRSKSTQRICLSNIDAKRLLDLNNWTTQTKLGNFSYSASRISLGDLKGNHFRLLIKDIKLNITSSDELSLEECLEKSIESFKTNGFINYYGLQRFGSYSTATHTIGEALLQMQWEKVFDMILEVKDNDHVFMKKAKSIWSETGNAYKAKKLIPESYRSIEASLIHGLARYYDKKDYLSVLNYIPRNVRLLYIHAFQSYIWNQLVTFRIEEYGIKPVVGDLVYVNPEVVNNEAEEMLISGETESESNASTSGAASEVPYKMKPEVKALTEEDLNNYTIFDVVLPLHGTDVQYPDNKVKQHAQELLNESGLSMDFMANYKAKSDIQRGAYRKIVVLPTNVSFNIIPYNENESLDSCIRSDLDLLLNTDKDNGQTSNASSSEELPKDKKCLHIEFSLPSSSYATMALRELLTEQVYDA